MATFEPVLKKIKKNHKRKIKGLENNKTSSYILSHGLVAFQTLETGLIIPEQLETCRRLIVKKLPFSNKIWFKVFPNWVAVSRSKGVRMGRGKGDFNHWYCKVKKGRILFEIGGSDSESIIKKLAHIKFKLPLKGRFLFIKNEQI
jgi:large subunit ribosomal protein L16